MSKTDEQSWQTAGQAKRDAIAALLPEQWRIKNVPSPQDEPDALKYSRTLLSQKELDLTENYTAVELLKQLASGALTSVEVLDAFAHRATIAHQLTNCLSEVMFAEARQEAEALDVYLKTHKKTIGPLHGLPISLKDQFRIRGRETSLGYLAWLGTKETAETESWLVTRLRELGAIFHCKTNVPSSLMAIETNNNIIGYTWNAHNRQLSSGGSSGGEASLLALHGSVLGLGSDVGASIRLPAAFSDIVGLKPSHGRVPYLKISNSMIGHDTVPSVIGPLGHSVTDLELALKTIVQLESWTVDPKVQPIPWREDISAAALAKARSRKLKIGFLRTDGFVNPHPPVARAVDEAVETLRAAGFELVEWSPPAHAEAFQILWDTFAADGGIDIHKQLNNAQEPPVPELAVSYGDKLGHLPVATVNGLWEVQDRKYNYQTKYAAYWQSTGVDAVIAPASPSASYKPTQGRYFGYTGVFNVLDYSVVTVRSASKVDAAKDVPVTNYTPLNDFDKTVAADYQPATFDGMPIGLQVVCGRLEEEKVLAIAREVQEVLLASK